MDALSRLNERAAVEAREELRRCCGASRWAEAMIARRPFRDREALLAAADEVWWGLDESDWREAFAHHPKIGDKAGLGTRFASTRRWAEGEQAGAVGASEEVLDGLAAGNRAYEERFRHIFIVCASGKTADEMLSLLRARLPNDPRDEIRIAAAEQAKITRVRLEKLLAS
jgi:2-oxo-4-hydroxy-4-carboxy-5-ureidoimidazoline decarboxylase